MDMRGGVKSCAVCGPYVIVLLQEGVIGLLQLKEPIEPAGSPQLLLSWPQLSQASSILYYCYIHEFIVINRVQK